MAKKMKIPVFCTVILIVLSTLLTFSFGGVGSENRANAPILTNNGVTPTSGDETTTFYFYITYIDLDGDTPVVMNIIIDNQFYTMKTNDTDPTRGMFYSYSTKLSSGNHTYYYYANNTKAESVRNPTQGSLNFYVGYSNPPNYPQFYNRNVIPLRPLPNQLINFTIQYKDPGNRTPDNITLNLREINAANEWTHYDVNIVGSSYTTGVTCYKTLKLAEGEYRYQFTAKIGDLSINDTDGDFNQLIVGNGTQNNLPALWDGVVSPESGTANNTLFTYSVYYSDGLNNIASSGYVVIDNTYNKMNVNNTRNPSSSGTRYVYSTTLTEGWHIYYFIFSDGRTNVTLPKSGNLYGPNVTRPGTPVNRAPTVKITASPLYGTINTTFGFNSTASDPDGDKLTYKWIFSDGFTSTKTGVSRKFNQTGNYTATLTVTDTGGLTASATLTVLVTKSNIPPRNYPPVIKTNLKPYNYFTKGTTITISAKGTYDPDNDPITYNWKIISPASNQQANYKVVEFNYTFSLETNYTIVLEVSDSVAMTTGTYYVLINRTNTPNRNPVAKATVTVKGMTAMLSGKGSYDPDGTIVSYVWSVENKNYNGMYHNHTFTSTGYKTATLTVKDDKGLTGRAVVGFYISNRTGGNNSNNRNYNNTRIGSHVRIESNNLYDTSVFNIDSEADFSISIIERKLNYLRFNVESESTEGRLIVLDLVDIFVPELIDQILIKMDGEYIDRTDLDSILQSTGDDPLFNIIDNAEESQLMIYIPHFSIHTFEAGVKSNDNTESMDKKDSTLNSYLLIGIAIAVFVILIAIAFIRIKKKKVIEYYNDFRVAEERAMNGSHSKSDDEDAGDWDDYI